MMYSRHKAWTRADFERPTQEGCKSTMRTLEPRLEKHIDLLISRYPALGEVKQAMGLTADIKGRRVSVVEDIVDSGNTIVELKRILEEKGASESRICTLLLKPDAYKKDIKLDYVAMEIPNDFIVGFGLDYDELGRNLKDIYVLDK